MCNADGRVGEDICNAETGVCDCKDNVVGDKCEECAEGYFNFPECTGDLFLLQSELFHYLWVLFSK